MGKTYPNITVFGYRFRDDTAGVTANSGWLAAQGSGITITADTAFRLRLGSEETAGGNDNGATSLEYSHNSGTWTPVPAAKGGGHPIFSSLSAIFTDGQATDSNSTGQLITGNTQARSNGQCDEASNSVSGHGSNTALENEFALEVDSANASATDTIALRIASATSGATYGTRDAGTVTVGAAAESHSGTATLSGTSSNTASGQKGGQSSLSISGTSSNTATGQKGGEASVLLVDEGFETADNWRDAGLDWTFGQSTDWANEGTYSSEHSATLAGDGILTQLDPSFPIINGQDLRCSLVMKVAADHTGTAAPSAIVFDQGIGNVGGILIANPVVADTTYEVSWTVTNVGAGDRHGYVSLFAFTGNGFLHWYVDSVKVESIGAGIKGGGSPTASGTKAVDVSLDAGLTEDGDFETDIANWRQFPSDPGVLDVLARDTGWSSKGAASLEVEETAAVDGSWRVESGNDTAAQLQPVVGGANYLLRGKVRFAADSTETAWVSSRILWYTATPTYIGQTAVGNSGGSTPNTTYDFDDAAVVAPDNAAYAKIQFSLAVSGAPNHIHYNLDEITLFGQAARIHGGGLLAATYSVATAAFGTATLSGGGTLTASGQKGAIAAVTISGGGSLSVTFTTNVSQTATLSGGGSLTVIAASARGPPASATISGTADITATGASARSSTPSLSGGGTLTATGSAAEAHSGSAALSGGGSTTASGSSSRGSVAGVSGSGTAFASVTTARDVSSSISGGGTAGGTGDSQHLGSALISGGGATTATGAEGAQRAAAISGGGSLTATFYTDTPDVAAIHGGGSLTGQGVKDTGASISISGTGNLATVPEKGAQSTGSISGGGSVTATGSSTEAHSGTATLSGTADITATGTTDRPSTGAVSGNGSTTSTGSKSASSTTTISGGGTPSSPGTSGRSAGVSISGGGTLAATGVASIGVTGTAILSGGGAISATGAKATGATSLVSGGGDPSSTESTGRSAGVSISAAAGITASGTATEAAFGTATLSGGGVLGAQSAKGAQSTASLSGGGALTASGSASEAVGGAAALSGGGTLVASTTTDRVVWVTNSGGGDQTTGGTGSHTGTAGLSGGGDPSAVGAGLINLSGVAVLSGGGSITATTISDTPETVAIHGSAGITGSGVKGALAAPAISGGGSLSVNVSIVVVPAVEETEVFVRYQTYAEVETPEFGVYYTYRAVVELEDNTTEVAARSG